MRRALPLLVALLLAGCTNLPTSGPVQRGGPLDAPDETLVQYLASGPSKGATKEEILEGFLAAGAAAQDNYRVARLFLADDFSADWNPLQETVIRGGNASSLSTGDNSMSYSTSVVARVVRGGFYAPEDAGASQSFEFDFTQVNGEWRISQAPDAVFLTSSTFETVYQPYPVYFYADYENQFVPDVRYFPRAGDPATEIARAVIAGPSEYLPNTVTAFPEAVALASAPVTVTEGRALVDVTSEIIDATASQKRAMLTQMTVSLGSVVGISSVSFTVDGSVLSIAEVAPVATTAEPTVDERPLVVRDGKLGFVDGDGVDALGELGARVMALEPTSVSYDDSGVVAVGSARGIFAVGDDVSTVSEQPSDVAPQVDSAGAVWWVSSRDESAIGVFADGNSREFPGPWGSTGTIRALEVSREDARIAIAVETAAGPRLYVASIGRDNKGRVVTVNGFHRLPLQGSSVGDIAWVDGTHVAAITKTGSVYTVELASVGGVTTSFGQPTRPESIVGGNGRTELVIRSTDGQLWWPRAGGWQSRGIATELLATQR